MTKKQSWQKFKDCGLLWWVNSMLHLLGWALTIEYANDGETIIECYPARVKYRGFHAKDSTNCFINVTKYLKDNINDLYEEALLTDDESAEFDEENE